MKLDSSLSMSRTFLLALSYTEQLSIVSRYILKYLFFFIILAMSLSLYSVISNYISSMVPYYGMMGAIGMKKTSMLLSFVFEQFIMIIVSVFVSFPIYEIFVVLINKVISARVGEGIELKFMQVITIALRSSVICSFIILSMGLFIFLMSFSKNIISMMKKVWRNLIILYTIFKGWIVTKNSYYLALINLISKTPVHIYEKVIGNVKVM